jgi:glutamate dehydrogenase
VCARACLLTPTQVLRNAIPKTLADTIGFDKVVKQVPENYLRALFASHVASRFVYAAGLQQSDFAFYEFVEKYV